MGDNLSSHGYQERAVEWASAFAAGRPRQPNPVRRADYTLHDLARRGAIAGQALRAFTDETLLADFAWRLVWYDPGPRPDAKSAVAAVDSASGFVVLVHGWDGSGEVWEDLPALLVRQNPRLVALVPDVNGFGGTPFTTDLPPLDKCNPPAVMVAVERWLDMIGLRPRPGNGRVRPFVFVGHSMGGAALFFLDESGWPAGWVGRIAAAPALLMNDRQRRGLYRALGAGIHLSGLNNLLDRVAENLIAPRLIDVLAGWGSEHVRAEHHRVYKNTPEGVVARTFTALGRLDVDLARASWPDFVVYLAHHDRLVGFQPTLELLEAIHFSPDQIRTVQGDHYFFSVGRRPDWHAPNRERLLGDVLAMSARLISRHLGRNQ